MRLKITSALTSALSPTRGSAADAASELCEPATAFVALRLKLLADGVSRSSENLSDAVEWFSLSWGRGPG
jgi:hypothetical protein